MTPWQRLRNWFGPAVPDLPDGWASAPLILVVGRSGPMKAAVASLPWLTVRAGNGRAALALAAALQPDVIVIDASLPRLGGERLVDELRRRRDLDRTSIVLLTGRLDGDARRALLRRGVQDLLTEPFEASELSARVARIAESQRRAEILLRQQYPLLRAVMDQTPDRIFVKDRQGRYLAINPAGARQLGRSIADVVGKDDSDFLSPKAARKRMEEERQVMDRGESQTYEEAIQDGNTERVYLVTKAPYLQPGGIGGLIGIFRDVTGLKQAQTEHLRQIVETANDAFIGIDPGGAITEWNRRSEAMFGWSRAEAIGLPMIETLIPPRHREARRAAMKNYLKTGAGMEPQMRIEMSVLHRDGQEIPVEVTIWPGYVNGTQHFNAFMRDNRERLRQELLRTKHRELEADYRRAQEASRLKSQFVANMSHELRTPLNAVIGFAELLFDGKVGPSTPQQNEFLEDILSSSRHLLNLINSVLDMARVESGKIELQPERVVVEQLVGEVCEALKPMAARRGSRVNAEIDPEVREVVIDPTRLKQVLYNYLSNAVKFTPAGGRITVRVIPAGAAWFRLEVEDTGIGIKPEDQHRLFVEFQQLDAGTGKQFQGTGLGLALTKRIVEAHGGHVGLRSAYGAGTAFFAVLPRAFGSGPSSAVGGD